DEGRHRRLDLKDPAGSHSVAATRCSRLPRPQSRRCAGVGDALQFSDQSRQRHRRRHRDAGRDGAPARQRKFRGRARVGDQADRSGVAAALLRQRRFPSTAAGERRAEMLDASADLDSIGWYQANQRRDRGRASMSKHVAVLMGGWSAEREISLRSGKACADALARLGHRVTRIDVGRDIAAVLTTVKPDLALNMLHGRPGEDGTLQGVLEILAIPYSHSGVMASALAMQKDVAKELFRGADVPVPEGLVAWRFEVAKGHVLPPPYVIKPIAEGSSVGVFIVREDHAHPPQELTREDWPYGERLIVEKYIAGKELTCAVMGDTALGVIEIVPTVRFYDYEAKYVPGASKHLLPAPVSSIVYQQVRRLALAAQRALGCRGVSRADFRYDDRIEGTGGLVCLEVNTQPGMTETSLVPELAAHAGITFDGLVQWMIEDVSLN